MTELKREYVIPLRRKTRNAPKWRRSKKAVSVLKDFVRKHMKTDNVVVCPELNEKLWENGIKNPPGKVEVVAVKMSVGGIEKTIVNLIEIGVKNYVEAYKAQATQASSKKEETTAAKEEKSDVKSEEKPEEDKKEESKTDSEKTEVKKDE